MKIQSVKANQHKKAFEVRTYREKYDMPYAMLDLRPSAMNTLSELYVDEELGNEAFTYKLESGDEDSIHIDRVMEVNRDPAYMRDLLLYKLTLKAKDLVEDSGLSVRYISKRLGTSPTQFYRLLDVENKRKSIDRMVELLSVLGCTVDVSVQLASSPSP